MQTCELMAGVWLHTVSHMSHIWLLRAAGHATNKATQSIHLLTCFDEIIGSKPGLSVTEKKKGLDIATYAV